MSLLGIDPGMHETGWAVLDGPASAVRLIDAGVIRTFPTSSLPARLLAIHHALTELADRVRPAACAVEEMFFTTVATSVRSTLQARGVVIVALAQAGVPIFEYNPRTVKLALTGSGAAEKAQMQAAVQKALGMTERLRPNDVADAAAIAICHLRTARSAGLKVLDRWGAAK